MTSIPSGHRGETYAEGLLQAFSAVRALADLASDLGEETEVRTRFTVHVRSEAEVDAAGALLEVTPGRTCPWSYEAVKHQGTVTIMVTFTAPSSAPADARMLDAVRHMAAGNAAGSAA